MDPTNDIAGERKFIVFESQLVMLFKMCRSCSQEMVKLKTSTSGTLFEVKGICPDEHVLHWQSQPVVRRIPAGNLLLAAAILLSGQTFTSFANLADVLNLVMFGERRYYDLQREYVYPVVHTTYVRQREAIVEYLSGSQLHLSVDGRCDSLSHSTKYCTYTLTDSATDLILDYSLVQCTQTGTSVAMEKEGLGQYLDKLMEQDVDISTRATDRHTGFASLMKTDYPHIQHQCDVWHLAKSVTKKLGMKAKTKHCGQLLPWILQPLVVVCPNM